MRLTQKTDALIKMAETKDDLAEIIAKAWLDGARYAWVQAEIITDSLPPKLPKHIRKRNPYGKV